jgi:hypothetical protein
MSKKDEPFSPVNMKPANGTTRKGGALTKNQLLRGVNRIMKVLADFDQQDQERIVRMTVELVNSQRPGQADTWRPTPANVEEAP